MKFLIVLWIAKFFALAVNMIDKNRGSNYAGKIAVKLMPDFVSRVKGIDYDKVVFVTGTNGKSTTTNLIRHTLISAGKQVACNAEGANMMAGVATTLIKNTTLGGKFNKELLVLEIDERSFPGIYKQLPGRHMGFTNLQKDQVQRNGDPDFILRKFRNAITKDMTLYLNNEEPRSRSLEDVCGKVCYFSVADNPLTYERKQFYDVTMPCPKCGHGIVYERFNLAHIGPFHCSGCDYGSVAEPDVRIDQVDFENKTFCHNGKQWKIHYNNPFYIYNYAMCIAICRHFGLTDQQMLDAFAAFKNPVALDHMCNYQGKEIHYLRAKQENPEAFQSQLDIIATDKRKKVVMVGLYRVADFDPHYAGTFYFFDCDFDPVIASGVEHYVAFSENVSYDLAARMMMAGVKEEDITVVDSDDIPTIFRTLENVESDVVYVITNIKHFKPIMNYLTQGGGEHA